MPRVLEYSLSSGISIFGSMDICSMEPRSIFFIIHDCSGARSCLLSGRVWGEKKLPPYNAIITTHHPPQSGPQEKNMDSRGIEPRTTPRTRFEALLYLRDAKGVLYH